MLGSLFNVSLAYLQGCQMADIFAYQKFQYGYILEALGMENVGVPIL
jgi:hypothetical protein